MYYTAMFWVHPPPSWDLFPLYEEEPGGSQPPWLQEKVQQCAVHRRAARRRRTHDVDPGLLGKYQVVEVLRKLDVPAVEQVTAVPLISSNRPSPQRYASRADGARIFTGGHCRACPGAEGSSSPG